MKKFILFLIFNLLSQTDLDITKKEDYLGKEAKRQIENELGAYFKRETFLVDAKVKLIKLPQPTTEDKYIPKEEKLPGLPIAIPTDKETEKEIQVIQPDKGYKIDFINTVILISQGAFNTDEIEFIIKLVKMRLGFDEQRGDTLEVQQLPFPKLKPPPETEEAQKPQPVESFPDTVSKLAAKYAIIIFLVLLILVFILLLSILFWKKKPQAVKSENIEEIPLAATPTISPPKPVDTSTLPSPLSAPPKEKPVDNIILEAKKYLVSLIVGSPAICSKISNKWIEEGDDGINRIAMFYKSLDQEIFKFLEDSVDRKAMQKINSKISEIESPDNEKVLEIWDTFRTEYNNISKEERVREELDIFNFLNHLQSHQVLHMVKDEPPGVISVILAQLEPDIRISVFKELPKELQYKTMVELGRLKKIPIGALKDIASRLSHKAYEAAQIKFVATDGIDAIVGLLERMDTETEKEMLSIINEQDMTIGEEINKIYLTFSDIIKIPDKILVEITRPMDKEILAKALIDSEIEIQNKILKCLNERMQIMVKDLMESLVSIPGEEVRRSRLIIIREIRNLAREGKINLKKILKKENENKREKVDEKREKLNIAEMEMMREIEKEKNDKRKQQNGNTSEY